MAVAVALIWPLVWAPPSSGCSPEKQKTKQTNKTQPTNQTKTFLGWGETITVGEGVRNSKGAPEGWTEQEQPGCVGCVLWALEEDAFWPEQESRQILFFWLIGHLFRCLLTHTTRQQSGRPCPQGGTRQNKAQSCVVLFIQINDPHPQMKLMPDRLLALWGQQGRADEVLFPQRDDGCQPHCPAPHVASSRCFLSPHPPMPPLPRGLQVPGLPRGSSPKEGSAHCLRCNVPQMAALGIHSTGAGLKWEEFPGSLGDAWMPCRHNSAIYLRQNKDVCDDKASFLHAFSHPGSVGTESIWRGSWDRTWSSQKNPLEWVKFNLFWAWWLREVKRFSKGHWASRW